MHEEKAKHYDVKYRNPNYFGYSARIYRPYMRSLIESSGLARGSTVLDVGCGQGFFSSLFSECGMKVNGIDLSESGISVAKNMYGHLDISFSVADIETVVFPEKFDCVFVRSCSLYNADTFANNDEVTSKLLKFLKASGTFIFVYNSNFSGKPSEVWRLHSWKDMKQHFAKHRNTRLYFSIKFDTLLLRRYAFSSLVTRLNILLSRWVGIGGELICVLRKD